MIIDLAKLEFVALEKAVAPMTYAEAKDYAGQLEGWSLSEDGTSIMCHLTCETYDQALECVNRVSEVAQELNHHPDICFGWGYCRLMLRTHIIHGLHKNDFIAAARFNEVIKDIK